LLENGFIHVVDSLVVHVVVLPILLRLIFGSLTTDATTTHFKVLFIKVSTILMDLVCCLYSYFLKIFNKSCYFLIGWLLDQMLRLSCDLAWVSNYIVIYVVIVNYVCDIGGSLLNISLSILLFFLALFFF
jgi:hypothetical protein